MKSATACLRVGLAAGLVLSCAHTEHEPHGPWSVLLVTLDTTRADALSCYGAAAGTTPELDTLAREGVLYERAFTTAPITLSAHTSILTGLTPLRHGLRDNGIAALDPAANTLAEAAHAAGIQTAAFVGAIVLDRALGLDQGFDVYDGPEARRSTSGHPSERPAREVVDAALAWLAARERAKPFFAWVHLYDAHYPYAPRRALPETSSERERYQAEVSEVDAELARLFGALRSEGALAHTLLCVTADHGEAFGEHQELTHGVFCWNTTLHVPLLLRFPDGWRAGERSQELVSLVDVAPTLAEVLGVTLGSDIDGGSLLHPRPSRGLYFESYTGYLAFGWSPLTGWIDEGGKYVQSSHPEFFDLAHDPSEEHDLASERGAALEPYRAAIAALAARPALQGVGSRAGLDDELRKSIQALGYAGAESSPGVFPHPLAANQRPSPHAMVAAWRESMVAKELMNRGRFPDAAALLQRLVAADPGNSFVRGELATALMKLKRHQEAFDVLLPILAPDAEGPAPSPQVYFKLGVCAAKLGQRAEAERYLARAVELAPQEARYRQKLEQLQSGADTGDDE